jgi:hypothetical protein
MLIEERCRLRGLAVARVKLQNCRITPTREKPARNTPAQRLSFPVPIRKRTPTARQRAALAKRLKTVCLVR